MRITIGEQTGRADLSALRDTHYPLTLTVANRLTIRLSLPEAGLRLAPLASQEAVFGSFDVLQRTISSLEQLAQIQRAPVLAVLEVSDGSAPAVPEPEPEPEPEPAPEPAPEPDPAATVQVVGEDGERLTVALAGVHFAIQRNQLRADGTLTPRAQRVYEQAKAAAEAATEHLS